MKTKILLIVVSVFYWNLGDLKAQYEGKDFSLNFSFNYTTTSKLFLSPNASDPVVRATYSSLDDIYSYALELKYRVSEPLIIGFYTEYLRKTGAETQITAIRRFSPIAVDVNDGYVLIPVEFSIYYLLPFSTEDFKFYMGGGVGAYFGSHVKLFEDVEVSNVSREFAFGIQVNLGMDYRITDFLTVGGGMKFRDPEFEMESKYNKAVFTMDGEEVLLRDDTFDSKVNIDGVTFYLSVSYQFNLF
ncbi:MAG: hypothetical protein A2V66_02660 [Ignavibacteria bacterium RBG_13_36_8]|nr:MAG: hypothetical protein A2V66_02660 [Ignavibacteria bacterium RBG_13_36_8]